MLALLKQAFRDFVDDECPRMAASMSYFTVFSLPALMVLVLLILGVFVDPADMQGRIRDQIAGLIGTDGASFIDEMILAANQPSNRGVVPTVLGILALLFGATGAFGELQSALNRAWEVKPDPRQGGIKSFIGKRILSLGMVATISFLLLVSLVVSAAISAFGDVLGGMLGGVSEALIHVVQLAVSLAVISALFAVIFKILPDAKVAWRDVWVGAAFTTALFVAGKYLIGFYLSKSNPGSSFGAAGALAVIMVWIYYSAMILFLGAEFTQVWATEKGGGIEPEEGAVHVETKTRIVPKSQAPRRSRKKKRPAGAADGASYP
jgi:membrane protein